MAALIFGEWGSCGAGRAASGWGFRGWARAWGLRRHQPRRRLQLCRTLGKWMLNTKDTGRVSGDWVNFSADIEDPFLKILVSPSVPDRGSGRQSGAEAGARAVSDAFDAPSDVTTAVMHISCPDLRKGVKYLFTFKYLEVYIYHLLTLPGRKRNAVFISLVLQTLGSALCRSAVGWCTRSRAIWLSGWLQQELWQCWQHEAKTKTNTISHEYV